MAEENVNDNSPMTVLKMPIICLVAVFAAAILMIVMYLAPAISSLSSTNSSYNSVLSEYNNKMAELGDLKASAELAESQKNNSEPVEGAEKGFFKPMESGSDPDVVLAGEFNEVLSLITANQIKTRSVKYDYEPKGDPFFDYAQSRYSVCKLDMQMIASYANFKNFLKDLYKHDHYLDISKIEIEPYSKDKSILLISFQLKLYAEKA